ncbi:hypothetical protein LCGC14_1763560 [marine sediment metagenome]|uniref:Gp5/Type VI secretion system Vgr protein OB-fold domain-containing protein n=1 Tax=marine sediment metagenome TaxID=412755 RepID=A0A0F9JZZ6_9ZZZZ
MKIKIKNIGSPRPVVQAGIKANDNLKGGVALSGMWGTILSANSEHNTVNVRLESGIEMRDVAVRSMEWAGANSSGYGERDLPPKGCSVLIIFPGDGIESGFVLCSALNRFEPKHKTELLVSGKETEHLRVREGGLKETYDKSTGAYTLETNEAKIDIGSSGAIKISKNGGEVNIASDGVISISKNGGIARINADGSVEITPAATKDIKLAGGTVLGANDFPNCIFSGALHCTDVLKKVKVP